MKKSLSLFLIAALCVFALIFSACDSGSGGSGGLSSGSRSALKITLPTLDSRAGSYEKGDTVKFTVEIDSGEYNDSKDGNSGDTIEFNDVPIGEYTVTVIGKDENGNHVSKGTSKATVSAEASAPVPVKLSVLEYYDVTLLLQIGTPPSSTVIKVTKNEEFKLPECPFEIDGYEFIGWRVVTPQPSSPAGFVSADATTSGTTGTTGGSGSYQPPLPAGEVYELTGDTEFIAEFQEKTYNITYNGIDGAIYPECRVLFSLIFFKKMSHGFGKSNDFPMNFNRFFVRKIESV